MGRGTTPRSTAGAARREATLNAKGPGSKAIAKAPKPSATGRRTSAKARVHGSGNENENTKGLPSAASGLLQGSDSTRSMDAGSPPQQSASPASYCHGDHVFDEGLSDVRRQLRASREQLFGQPAASMPPQHYVLGLMPRVQQLYVAIRGHPMTPLQFEDAFRDWITRAWESSAPAPAAQQRNQPPASQHVQPPAPAAAPRYQHEVPACTPAHLPNAAAQPFSWSEGAPKKRSIHEAEVAAVNHGSMSPGTPHQPPTHHLPTYPWQWPNPFNLPTDHEPPEIDEPLESNVGVDGDREPTLPLAREFWVDADPRPAKKPKHSSSVGGGQELADSADEGDTDIGRWLEPPSDWDDDLALEEFLAADGGGMQGYSE